MKLFGIVALSTGMFLAGRWTSGLSISVTSSGSTSDEVEMLGDASDDGSEFIGDAWSSFQRQLHRVRAERREREARHRWKRDNSTVDLNEYEIIDEPERSDEGLVVMKPGMLIDPDRDIVYQGDAPETHPVVVDEGGDEDE